MYLPTEPGCPTDFDFFIGEWNVMHTRLKTRLAGASDWETFPGRTTVMKVLGGVGNADDNLLELPDGAYRAVTLRAFDAKTGTWSIWWLDGRTPGAIDVPVVGRFAHGVGVFLAHDTFNGTPIVMRFTWSVPSPDRPRWEQAFSADGGTTWETNWTMEFTRR